MKIRARDHCGVCPHFNHKGGGVDQLNSMYRSVFLFTQAHEVLPIILKIGYVRHEKGKFFPGFGTSLFNLRHGMMFTPELLYFWIGTV